MTTPADEHPQYPRSPIGESAILGRRIRQDDLSTLGTSTQTLAEDALCDGH